MTSHLLPTSLLSSTFIVLANCFTPAIVALNDGRGIQTMDTLRYGRSSGFYELEQLDGKRTRVNRDQMRSIKDM